MARTSNMAERTRSDRASWAIMAAAVLIATFATCDVVARSGRNLPRDFRTSLVPQDARPNLTDAAATATQRHLSFAPLASEHLNAILVARASDLSGDDRGWALLDRMGYRHSDAQVNLMIRAAAATDVMGVARHADALVRRDKFASQATSHLLALEQSPEGKRAIVAVMAGSPPWATHYLSDLSHVSGTGALEHRVGLLQQLDHSAPIPASALAAAMQKAVDYQAPAALNALASIAKGDRGKLGLNTLSPANFVPNSGEPQFPIVWHFPQTRHLQSHPTPSLFASMQVEWDGSSTATIAHRAILVPREEPDRSFGIALEAAGLTDLKNLSLWQICPDAVVPAERRIRGKIARFQMAKPACAIPRIAIRISPVAPQDGETFVLRVAPDGGSQPVPNALRTRNIGPH
ncbi:hypothetical protein IDJ81_04105 [Tsuneonella flava]|uniref:Uncharacterized protein n=1 Tax=Tsuneonella flava TaxID=2055955 RepID=A0ABX7KBE3_9SPHN|nr:hypothetical protein [Tsuneonella flava]QSB45319.1 hypothetical protein IDJ81_04105 [Tsuneonella flava]